MANISLARLASWLLMGIAFSIAIYTGSNGAFLLTSQNELASAWDRGHHSPPPATAPGASNNAVKFGGVFNVQRPRLAVGQPLAKMSVPAADNWTGIILEGNDDRVLSGGPGHEVGSAYPGEPDNVVVSNHNTYSLQFSKLKAGDQIRLDTDYGRFVYRVVGRRVANADDRTITGHTGRAMLTFTTCYPLYLGAFATQRYVITADLVTS
ncbi:MAG: class D sortase [Candidatus Dormibacteria bacterium]